MGEIMGDAAFAEQCIKAADGSAFLGSPLAVDWVRRFRNERRHRRVHLNLPTGLAKLLPSLNGTSQDAKAEPAAPLRDDKFADEAKEPENPVAAAVVHYLTRL